MKCRVLSTLAILLSCNFLQAQDLPKNGISIGFGLLDFESAVDLSNNEIGDFINISERKKAAFSIAYWRQLTNHLDFSAQYVGAFLDYPFENRIPYGEDKLLSELDLALHAKLFRQTAIVNPFLTAGIGGFNVGSEIGAFAPLGVGLQFRLGNSSIILQAQYRLAITDNATDHLFYNLAFRQSFGRVPVQAPPPPPPPPPAPKDSDNDGLIDPEDECPTEAGPVALKGCPDRDADGIADKNDKCPDQRGVAKYEGCPVPDRDNDGINDEEDKCPDQAGVARYQGCPVPDRDNDGVNDEEDKCPDVAGPADNGGCPKLETYNFNAKNVQFATGSSKLLTSATKELDKLVAILNEYPKLSISIEGHTDNTGSNAINQKLSTARAESVKTYLVKKGVDASRLSAAGFGPDQPIADNKTAAGRAANRRVEFKARQ